MITDIKILKRIETLEDEVFDFPDIFDYGVEEDEEEYPEVGV